VNADQPAGITDISCAPDGGCTAAGQYTDRHGRMHAFIISEKNGSWGQAHTVRGISALGDGSSEITGISCPAAGRCSAVGHYITYGRTNTSHLFTLSQH
jgi:hypothetical protein